VVSSDEEILALYDIDYEVASRGDSRHSYPSEILAAMRRCQAAVIVVTAANRTNWTPTMLSTRTC